MNEETLRTEQSSAVGSETDSATADGTTTGPTKKTSSTAGAALLSTGTTIPRTMARAGTSGADAARTEDIPTVEMTAAELPGADPEEAGPSGAETAGADEAGVTSAGAPAATAPSATAPAPASAAGCSTTAAAQPPVVTGGRPTGAPQTDPAADEHDTEPDDSDDLGTAPTGAGSRFGGAPAPVAARTGLPDARRPDPAPSSAAGKASAPGEPSRAKRLLGKTKTPSDSSSKRIAKKIARRAVHSIVSDNAPSTQPIPIVAALKGTPYQAPVEAAAKSQDEAQMILDLAGDIGAIMLRAGADTIDVEASVIATCTSLGLPTVEVDLTSSSLTIHYADPEGRKTTVLRVNRAESFHYAKLRSVHRLVTDMTDGEVDYREARERVDAIRYQRRPYTPLVVTCGWAILAGAIVVLMGGGWVAAVLGMIMAALNRRLGTLLGGIGMPSFFAVMTQTSFTTFVAMVAWTLGLISNPQLLVASGIILLLPTQSLIAAVQDMLNTFPLTAASRLITVVMTMSGIVSGIALGLMVGSGIGLSPIEIVVNPAVSTAMLSTVISMAAALVVSACATVGMQGSRRFILPGAIVGLAGFTVYLVTSYFGFGAIFTSLLAATMVGLLARPIALRRGAPAIVLVIPGIFPLLQGLAIFSAVYEIVLPQEQVTLSAGLSSLFAAIIANAALGVGVVLGDYLAQPLFKRRRRRRAEQEAEESSGAAASGEAPVDPSSSP